MVVVVVAEEKGAVGRGGRGMVKCKPKIPNPTSQHYRVALYLVQQREGGVSVDGGAFACDSNTNAGKG
jgi:hypothetical protein